jgi:hypothetical protein
VLVQADDAPGQPGRSCGLAGSARTYDQDRAVVLEPSGQQGINQTGAVQLHDGQHINDQDTCAEHLSTHLRRHPADLP